MAWDALATCESGRNPRAINERGFYGLYQLSLDDWRQNGGSGNPIDASAGAQLKVAKTLYRKLGASYWQCGSHLYPQGYKASDVDVIVAAARLAGKPYVYAASGPNAFDAPGYVQFVYGRLGIQLPPTAAAQADQTEKVERRQAAPGDLVFLYSPISHVAIYAGDGRVWDAPHTGASVSLRTIDLTNARFGRVKTLYHALA